MSVFGVNRAEFSAESLACRSTTQARLLGRTGAQAPGMGTATSVRMLWAQVEPPQGEPEIARVSFRIPSVEEPPSALHRAALSDSPPTAVRHGEKTVALL